MPATQRIAGSVGQGVVGSREDVIKVQTLLKEKKLYEGMINGQCNPETIAAIKKFQTHFMRVPDGRIDPNGITWKKLTGQSPMGMPLPAAATKWKPYYQDMKDAHEATDTPPLGGENAEELFGSLGYDRATLGDQFHNTCATRMSLALLKTGVNFEGRIRIKKGEFTGRMFEPGAKTLADKLRKSDALGEGQYFYGANKAARAKAALKNEYGIILFHQVYNNTAGGIRGGHIDMFSPTPTQINHRYFDDASEIWFWKLELKP
jgi:peptidoglycan hydrolase-like protein with peptidoglycan-binding domain